MPVTNIPPSASSGNMENNCALRATFMDYLACKHVFHKNCVEAWLTENYCSYTCSAPITRNEIKVVVGNCSPSRSQQVPPPPDPVSRGVTTRTLARTLAQLEEANTATIPDPVPLNASGAHSSALDASQSTIQVEGIASRPIAVGYLNESIKSSLHIYRVLRRGLRSHPNT